MERNRTMTVADRMKRWTRVLCDAMRCGRAERPAALGPEAARRVAMTAGCRDTDAIPKVPRAGEVIDRDDGKVQVMHDGTLVVAGGYCGDWMTEIIRGLKGHHEPQEELVFHHLLRHCRPGTRIVEVGAFWAYYTNWYLGAIAGSTAVCVEPDASNMACGQRNLALNGRSATWVNACVGRHHAEATTMQRESDGATVCVACHSMESLLDAVGRGPIEMLHVDCQGAELPFLESLGQAVGAGLLRFVVVSTHHASISGSSTTHQDCLRQLGSLGATILCEHAVEESFSGDGLIAASFHAADVGIELPAISRNEPRESLFGAAGTASGDRRVVLADTDNGPMLVFENDTVIGRMLRERGSFEEGIVVDVVRFLRRSHGFRPGLFVDIGANIGSHLLRGLRDGTFPHAVGVEMDEDNFRLLTCNVTLNECQGRARLFNVAVSDTAGPAVMEVSGDNLGDHRMRSATLRIGDAYGEAGRKTRTITATTLDRLEADCGTAFDDTALLWIDTQGHEGQVLDGARGILARDRRPFVVIEFWPYGIERCGGRDRVLRFLRRCRAIHDLRHPGWERRQPLEVSQIEELYAGVLEKTADEGLFHTDLLCIL
jgi:FkbM family methyltransferase